MYQVHFITLLKYQYHDCVTALQLIIFCTVVYSPQALHETGNIFTKFTKKKPIIYYYICEFYLLLEKTALCAKVLELQQCFETSLTDCHILVWFSWHQSCAPFQEGPLQVAD